MKTHSNPGTAPLDLTGTGLAQATLPVSGAGLRHTPRRVHPHRSLCRLTPFLCLVIGQVAHADITTDGSVGPALSLPGPDFQITADLGEQVGTNLFHSFSSFNIYAGESATFSSPVPVHNVISRITGGSSSHIDGLLRSTIPGADLYLINPHGVIFGDNAALDIRGSFYASTANYLALGETGRFDVSDPPASVLTTAPPSAFGFLGNSTASISVHDNLLQVPNGETLAMAGGNIDITDGNLYAPDGQVVLVSVTSVGEVPVDPATMNLDDFDSLGNISVANPSGEYPFIGLGEVGNLDVTTSIPGDAAGGGSIVIRGGEFVLDEGLVRAEVIEDTSGGGIDIAVSGTAELDGDAKLLTRTFFFSGDAGPITIAAESLVIGGDATISSDSSGAGAGGTITVTTDSVEASGRSGISSDALLSGNGGNILITTTSLDMADDSVIKTSTFGGNASGDAGNIDIHADNIVMAGDATINSSTELGSQGAGGQVTIEANSIQLDEAAWIISYTETVRDAGEISIDTNQLSMNDQSVISTTAFSSGNGGTITIDAEQLALTGDAVITSGTEGSGNAGNVIITAGGSIDARGNTTISSESEGGNFFVRGGTDLADATGGGDGGLVRLTASQVSLSGTAVVASGTSGAGAGGDVELMAGNISLNPAAGVSAISTGDGNAGNISVTVNDSLEMDGGFIRTRALTSDGGNITITAPNTVYLLDSEITTSVESGLGNGGNISIDPEFVILNNSRIVANAFGGDGGNITIVTNNYIASTDSIVDASSQFGLDGTVIIKSPEADLSSGLTELPESFLNVAALLREPCSARRSVNQSSFIVRGRSAIPPGPMSLLPVMGAGYNGSAVSSGNFTPKPVQQLQADTGLTLAGLSGSPTLAAALIECGL